MSDELTKDLQLSVSASKHGVVTESLNLDILKQIIKGGLSMSRANQETITTFGEVMHSANISYPQNRSTASDNRLKTTLVFAGGVIWDFLFS